MNENLNIDEITTEEKLQQTAKIPESVLSMDYVLARIDKILNDTAHIHEAIKAVQEIPIMIPADGMINYSGDYAGQAKAEAISKTVLSRETTNQQLIHLFEKMYDDLKPNTNKANLKEKALDLANRTFNNTTVLSDDKELLTDVLEAIRHIEK